jgi:hypothetical protein
MWRSCQNRRGEIVIILGAGLALLRVTAVRADDVIFARPIADLKIVEGTLPPGASTRPASDAPPFPWGRGWFQQVPYAVLDQPGEAYLDHAEPKDAAARQRWLNRWSLPLGHVSPDDVLAVRIPSGPGDGEVKGRLFVPAERGMVAVRFILPRATTTPDAVRSFAEAKRRHFEGLLRLGGPGAPWFRHQVRDAISRLPRPKPGDRPHRLRPGLDSDFRTVTSLDQTYDLFSGGRAISENLQFDRPLTPTAGMMDQEPAQRPGPGRAKPEPSPPVKVDTLVGITVAAIDWKQKLAGQKPALDPLARAVPADQHALFLPGLAAAQALLGEFQETAVPALELADSAEEVVPVQRRYERQLGVSVADLAGFQSRAAGTAAIRNIAVTGSDPYFATDTDLALIFEVEDPAHLVRFLRERMEAACKAAGQDVRVVDENRDGVKVTLARTSDRSLSTYLAVVDGVVLLTSSPWQVEQVSKAIRGRLPRLADADEYRFFRARYPRNEADETGFVVLSDATIRRWCGPRWRIGSSRRVRVDSLLASLQADHLEELVSGGAGASTIPAPDPGQNPSLRLDPGHLRLSRTGVISNIYGSLLFPTPIAEIPLDDVTQAEASAYTAWRNGYQMNWRGYFDPIAIRLGVQPRVRLTADLTVMPLIAGTDYKPFIELSGRSKIAPGDGDLHPGTLLHAILALDVESSIMQQGGSQISLITRIPQQVALSWLGHFAALYLDEDPFWAEAAKQPVVENFLMRNLEKIPLGLHVQVTDGVRLALFLGALRAYLEQSSPDLLAYETREHNGRRYVRAGERRTGPGGDAAPAGGFALFYAATSDALVVSPNERVVTRFLDRLDKSEGKVGPQADRPPVEPHEPWLGESLAVQASRDGLQLLEAAGQSVWRETLQRQSWSNLPILNEYRRLFPDRDPVQVHEDLWGVRPICPGGGRYVWNETWRTMESTAFGCPAAPKPGPDALGALKNLRVARFGLTFEEQGLCARVAIDRQGKP